MFCHPDVVVKNSLILHDTNLRKTVNPGKGDASVSLVESRKKALSQIMCQAVELRLSIGVPIISFFLNLSKSSRYQSGASPGKLGSSISR